MTMHWSALLVAVALLSSSTAVQGAQLRASRRSVEATRSSEWAAYLEAESEDRSFLLGQLAQTESELLDLQKLAEGVAKHSSGMAALQISATPSAPKANATKAVAKNATKETAKAAAPAKAAAKAPKVPTDAELKDMDPAKLVASLGLPSMKLGGKMGKAALMPMLAMLKGLYEDSKSRISEQNAREEKSKKWFAEKEKDHNAKLAKIEGKWKNHTLSDEFHTNETRDENRYFGYWQRCRERQHRQFHTNLKIQHAMMQKVKMMVNMYEKTLSGKAEDKKEAGKQLQQLTGGAMPEVVLLQEASKAVLNFCHESLLEVRKEKDELREMAKEGVSAI